MTLLKRHWPWLLVLAFMAFGFWLRVYHIDYPSVGYHNWKEARYIGPARNFAREGFFQHGFFVPAYDVPGLRSDPSGAHSDLFPYSSIFAALLFMAFGFELWAARLPVLLFSVAAIPLMYLVVRRLFKREDIALTACFLTVINPLFIFFTHNVDQMPFGLTFVLIGLLFYVRWAEEARPRDLILALLFIALAIDAKYTYLIVGIPMAFIFPWARLKQWKRDWKTYAYAVLAFSVFPLWLAYSNYIIALRYKSGAQAKLSSIDPLKNLLSDSFWSTMKAYAADNYTLIGIAFAVLGILFLVILFAFMKQRGLGNRFLLGYVAGVPVFFFLFSQNLAGHTYHQYPIAPAVVLFMAFFFVIVGTTLGNMVKVVAKKKIAGRLVKLGAVIVFVFMVYSPSMGAKDRMFDTQFPGLDIAGDYVHAHKRAGERILMSTGQTFGLLWYADIKSAGRGIPASLDDIRFAEEERNATWLFIYNWDFSIFQDKGRWPHLSERYSIRQVGFTRNSQQTVPLYLLLYRDEKGFDINKLNEYTKDRPVLSREYEYSFGKVPVYYVNTDG